MPAILQCDIVTPEARFFSAEGTLVVVPASSGEMGIMRMHMPIVTTLGAGEVRVTLEDSSVEHFAISGGYVQVQDGVKVIVLADRAKRVADIDKDAVQAKLAELEGLLESAVDDDPMRPFWKSEQAWAATQLAVLAKN